MKMHYSFWRCIVECSRRNYPIISTRSCLRSSDLLKSLSFIWISVHIFLHFHLSALLLNVTLVFYFSVSFRIRYKVSPEITPGTAPCSWTRLRLQAPASTTVTSATRETTPARTIASTPCWQDPTANRPPQLRLHTVPPQTLRGGWRGRDTSTALQGGWSCSTRPAVRTTNNLRHIICCRGRSKYNKNRMTTRSLMMIFSTCVGLSGVKLGCN